MSKRSETERALMANKFRMVKVLFFLMALLCPSSCFGFQSLHTSGRENRGSCDTIIHKAHKQRLLYTSHYTTLLQSTSQENTGGSNDSEKPPRRFPNPLLLVKRGVKRVRNASARFTARFQALSRKAKRIVLLQFFILAVTVGSIGKNIYAANGPPPPVEVSYSSFLDLVERQESAASDGNVPVMNEVRIGTDRIVYRLYRNPKEDEQGGSSTTSKLPLELPSLSPKSAKRLLKQQQQRPYMTAYTRKITATPPELVNQLRSNKISFAAAATPRASTLAVVLRSSMVVFYFLILFRIYKTVSGAGGKSDTPGKLAQTSDLPLASFDDIQGIPTAKAEVMELVDALRNPDKYAILGARAPTGLLLVGPPGTGSKSAHGSNVVWCMLF